MMNFRLVLCVSIALFSFVGAVNAQKVIDFSMEDNPIFNDETKIAGGLVLGLNATQVDGDYLNGYHRVGLNVGVTGMFRFGHKFYGNIDILYSQKGAINARTQESPLYGSYFSMYRIKLNYAEVPLVLHYKLMPRVHIGIGAAYNVLIGSREEVSDANGYQEIDPVLYGFNSGYFDWLTSMNIVLYKGLVANVRYQYSLTTIRPLNKVMEGMGFTNQMNNQFSFRLLYFF